MDPVWIAIGGFIFLAYTLEAITGFGSIVIALSLSAQLVPIDVVLPVLVPLSVCMSGYLVWRHWRDIDRRLLFKTILPGMVLGTLIGYGVKPFLDEGLLKQIFGLLILWFSGRELWKLRHATAQCIRPRWHTNLLTAAAGISHGLFASGGPLLVYSLRCRIGQGTLSRHAGYGLAGPQWLVERGVLFRWKTAARTTQGCRVHAAAGDWGLGR